MSKELQKKAQQNKEILNQKQIWDAIAKAWNDYRQKPISKVNEFLKNKKGKILDLSCGSGRHLLKSKDLEFYETDFSEKMIEFAKKNAEKNKIKAHFQVADATNLPFEDNFFDSAIYIAALHCIQSVKDRKKSLKELFRVLKKDSEALITVWSKMHLRMKNKSKDAIVPWTFEGEKYQRYYYLYEKNELESLLKQSGFKIQNIEESFRGIIAIVTK